MAQHLRKTRKDIADSAAATDAARVLASKYATHMPQRSIHAGASPDGPLTKAAKTRRYDLRARKPHQHFSSLQPDDMFAGMTFLTNMDTSHGCKPTHVTQAIVPYQDLIPAEGEDLFAGMTLLDTSEHVDKDTEAYTGNRANDDTPAGRSGGRN